MNAAAAPWTPSFFYAFAAMLHTVLLGPCVNVGAQDAGASSISRERYISQLRAQFSAGLTVTVDASAVRMEDGFRGTAVGSRWNAVPAGELATAPTPGPRGTRLTSTRPG